MLVILPLQLSYPEYIPIADTTSIFPPKFSVAEDEYNIKGMDSDIFCFSTLAALSECNRGVTTRILRDLWKLSWPIDRRHSSFFSSPHINLLFVSERKLSALWAVYGGILTTESGWRNQKLASGKINIHILRFDGQRHHQEACALYDNITQKRGFETKIVRALTVHVTMRNRLIRYWSRLKCMEASEWENK